MLIIISHVVNPQIEADMSHKVLKFHFYTIYQILLYIKKSFLKVIFFPLKWFEQLFSCLFPFLFLTAPPLLPMDLATGSKPAVHPMSNVLYHSPPARISDLAAAHVLRDAGLSSRHVAHLLAHSVTQTCVDLTIEIFTF